MENTILVFDTETTGLWHKGDELDVTQPWPVQIGAVLLSSELILIGQLDILVKVPPGAVFDEHAVAIHGLTPELIEAEGMDMETGYAQFRELSRQASMIAAYNLPYDFRIMRTSAERLGMAPFFTPEQHKMCIMEQVQRDMERRVKLRVAYRKYTGLEIADAHDAFADTLAAAEVLRALVRKHS